MLGQTVLGELADGLEQGVAGAGGGVVRDDERLADERVEVPEHVDVVGVVDDRTEAGQVEAPGEDGGDAEERALVVGQQVVGPLDRVPQRELALGTGRRALQQAEPVGEPVPDLDRAHRRHARRGQLDAEREPVDGLADLGHRVGGLRIVEPEVGPHGPRPVDEERDRVGGHATVARQGRDRERGLADDGERLARRGDDPHPARAAEDRRDRRGGGGEDVLAVVDHEQQLPAGERLGDGLDEGGVALRGDAEHRRDRRRHRVRVAHRRELDQPDAVGELARDLRPDLDREAGLADPADAGQRDQPVPAHELGDLADDLLAPDHRAQLLREVAGDGVDAAQHGEVGPESLGEHLVHRHPAAQPPQPVLTERAQPHPVAQQHLGRVGHEHLPAVRDRHQPRGAVDLAAEVVPVALDRLTGVQAHANREVDGAVIAQLLLRLERRGRRVGRGRERRAEPVAAGAEHVAAVPLDRAAQDRVVDAQRVGHVARVLLPPTGGVLDVGEQERDRALGEPSRHGRTVMQTRGLRSAVDSTS